MNKKRKTKMNIGTLDARLTVELMQSLHETLTMDINQFESLGDVHATKDGPAIFIDNGADVLAVGHLDWVEFNNNPTYLGNHVLNCPQLDDRLGVWVLLHLLPALYPDFKYDVLLCDSEEIGLSTGQHHNKLVVAKYNWGFEFDRAGTDCVTYGYSDTLWDNEISNIADVNFGAFSDISYLEFLKCKMVNVGVGYHQAHSSDCYADLSETMLMVDSFAAWAMDNITTKHTHNPQFKGKGKAPSRWSFDDWDNENLCGLCHYESCGDQLICLDCQHQILDDYENENPDDEL